MEGRATRVLLRVASGLVLGFLYLPLFLVVIYAFSKTRGSTWPPDLFTTKWFGVAWDNPDLKPALRNSVVAGLSGSIPNSSPSSSPSGCSSISRSATSSFTPRCCASSL